MSGLNCCFLTCMQISQEVGQVVWYSHLLKNSPHFVVIHTVKGFAWSVKQRRCFSGFLLLLIQWMLAIWSFVLLPFLNPVWTSGSSQTSELKFTHAGPLEFTDSWNVHVHSFHLLFDHSQFILIYGPNIPCYYAILFLQHRTLPPSFFCLFVLVLSLHSFWSSFFHSFPVAYWTPTDLGSSSFSVISFWHFLLFMGFSRQEYWGGLTFSSPVENSINLTQIHPETINRKNISQMLFRVHHSLE